MDNLTGVVTVAAGKGGVGKTTLAYELAASLEGVLVDLDWDGGGATRLWGWDARGHVRAPLLDALESGQTPRPKVASRRPDIVPSHPDLAASRVPADLVAEALPEWSAEWGRLVIADTHPGANALTDGAMQGACVVVIPAVLGVRELDALEATLDDFAAYSLAVIPVMVPTVPPRRLARRLRALTDGRAVVGPVVSDHWWIQRRLRKAALTLEPNPGAAAAKAAEEYRGVADFLVELLMGA